MSSRLYIVEMYAGMVSRSYTPVRLKCMLSCPGVYTSLKCMLACSVIHTHCWIELYVVMSSHLNIVKVYAGLFSRSYTLVIHLYLLIYMPTYCMLRYLDCCSISRITFFHTCHILYLH